MKTCKTRVNPLDMDFSLNPNYNALGHRHQLTKCA